MRDAVVDARELRVGGALLLGCGAVVAAVPGDQGLPCPLRTLTGVPCPLCGMTTSVVATLHLDLGAALAANPAGPLLVLAALLVLALPIRRLRLPAILIYSCLAAMWLFELHRFSIV